MKTPYNIIKVLFVDDDWGCVEMTRDELESQGFNVTTASNGQEAIEIIEKESTLFDVIVTDYNMPLMNGHQLMQKLHTIKYRTPIILCTGNMTISQADANDWGFAGLLRKPYGKDELIGYIRNVL